MTRSMTGYATRTGRHAGWTWSWDMRSVNARGLDVRVRVPDWIEGLEQAVRRAVQTAVDRGNVSLTVKLTREGETGFAVDKIALNQALGIVREIEDAAAARGVALASARASDIASMRGVVAASAEEVATDELRAGLMADLPALLSQHDADRRREGAALEARLREHLAAVTALLGEAHAAARAQSEAAPARVRAAMERVGQERDLDEARLLQEVALVASRGDVTEELDRLDAHVAAAHALLEAPGPKGRKLDFLVQEFNREANTVCSKSQTLPLTRAGLDLKATIEQMREQVQNIE